MLLREYAIKWWFVVPPLHYLGKHVINKPETLDTWHLGKHGPRKLCIFNHAVYCVLKMTLRLLLQKFPKRVFFLDEKVFTVASPVNLQNDRVYASNDAKKRDIAAERLLRCRPTFSSSLMVSVAVSKLGWTELFFVKPAVKVDGRYRDDECRRYSKPKQCRFWDTVNSVTEKTQFPWFKADNRTHTNTNLAVTVTSRIPSLVPNNVHWQQCTVWPAPATCDGSLDEDVC